jgi:DNA repair protein RadC
MILDNARAAADLLRPLFTGAEGEKLAMLHLDAVGRMLALDEHVAKERHSVILPARDIIAAALAYGARGLIIAHNHPSGDPRPSQADIAATRRLVGTSERLGIRLHDHLVFARDDCRSFRALGLL